MPDQNTQTIPLIPGGGGGNDVPATDSGSATNPAASQPALNLDSKIQVDGKDFTVKQLLDQAQKVAQLEEERAQLHTFRTHTERLLDHEHIDPAAKEESMRYLLTARGYTPEEIEEAVAQALGGQEQQEPVGQNGNPRGGQTMPPEEQYMPTYDPNEMNYLKEKLRLMEEEQQKAKLNTLRRELGKSTTEVLDSHPKLSTLVKKLKELRGEEGFQETLNAIRAEVQDRTLKQLKLRTASTGQLINDAWIAEEVEKAAELTHKHYLSVIGDPNKIGRAPETVTGEDVWSKKQPLPPPSYQKGDNMGTASVKLREFGVDALSRLAAAGEGTGATKT